MACLHHESVLTVNPDSTEFCPLQDLRNLLAVGTYQLDEKTQDRHGLLHLYAISSKGLSKVQLADGTTDCTHHWQLEQTSAVPISGIFDMKWQVAQPARLLAACADGSLHVLALQLSDDTSWLVEQQTIVVSEGAMALSLDIAACGQRVVASSSAGTMSALQVPCCACLSNLPGIHHVADAGWSDGSPWHLTGYKLQASESETCVTAQWHAHDLEAWSAAFDRWQVHHQHWSTSAFMYMPD